ncbi:uncharacterized protein LOC110760919 isoform X2 [Prunus avium]|uniref:Uncharacterized protein LOC110760919 isoform X2 n=1 Tax=Prunus avium TaxID=42229 RepID=A0A6P5SXW2_PRUAV|nr:uncharacterized protein LOC110760919 isoform X2 [Prunus avium]
MARKSGVLIRQLFGNCSNPCAGLLHHRRKLLSNSIQTLTPNTIPSTTEPSLFACKLPLSSPNLHFVRRSDSGLLFSSPPKVVIISQVDDYKRAVKEVEDGLLPAVFYFIRHDRSPMWSVASEKLHNLRKQFPHVTLYKVISIPVPTFHFYRNGGKVAKVGEVELQYAFAKFYRYVVPIETTQPTSSFGMGERRGQQLVIRAKKDENDIGVVRGWKVGRAEELSQRRGVVTLSEQRGGLVDAVESGTAPSLHEVMQAVESLPGGQLGSCLWWFAKGLFAYKPEKRVMFSNVQGLYFKVDWLLHEMAEE